MDGVVKLFHKAKNSIQDAVNRTSVPPDERIQKSIGRLQRLEGIIKLLQGHFEKYAAAMSAAAEASYNVSSQLTQFYKTAEQKSRQKVLQQYAKSSLKLRTRARSVFDASFSNDRNGVVGEFKKWLFQIGRLRDRANDAQKLREEAIIAHQNVQQLREKMHKGNSLFGGSSNKREIAQALPAMEEEVQLKKAQYESLRTDIEAQTSKLVAARGRQLDNCWRKLMRAQVDFFRCAAEGCGPLESALNGYAKNPAAAKPAPPAKPDPPKRKAKPSPAPVQPKATSPRPAPAKPAPAPAPMANDDLLNFGSTNGLSKSNSSSQENIPAMPSLFGDFSDFQSASSKPSSPPTQPELSESVSNNGPAPAPVAAPDLFDFGNVSTKANGQPAPADGLGIFGNVAPSNGPGGDPLDGIFNSHSPSTSHSNAHGQSQGNAQSSGGAGGFDVMNMGPSRQNESQQNDVFDMFSDGSQNGAPPVPQGPIQELPQAAGSGLGSMAADIGAAFSAQVCVDKATTAVRNDVKAQKRINAAVAARRMEDDMASAQQANHIRQIEEWRYKLKPKLDAWQKSHGQDRDIRNLLTNLHTVLWPAARWKKCGLLDLTNYGKVRKQYQKAIRVIHPDRSKEAPVERQVISERTFEAINEAWKKFDASNPK